jgi:hypothetical protein
LRDTLFLKEQKQLPNTFNNDSAWLKFLIFY